MTYSTDQLDLLAHDAWARRLARSLVRQGEDSEDLVQEAYARALAQEAGPIVHVRGWFGRVLRNLGIEQRRAHAARAQRELAWTRERGGSSDPSSPRGAAHEPRDHEPSPDELAARAEVQERLAAAVLALEPRQRDVILLRYFDGASVADIARRLGLAPPTVHEHLARGQAELRRRLASWEHDTRLSGGFALLLGTHAGREVATAAAVSVSAGVALAPSSAPLILLMSTNKLILVVALAAAFSLITWRVLDRAPQRTEVEDDTQIALAREDTTVDVPVDSARALDTSSRATREVAAPETSEPASGLATLRVRVVDERGVGVKGARVSAGPAKSAGEAIETSSEPGAKSLILPQGDSDADGMVSLIVDAKRALKVNACELWSSSSESQMVAPLRADEVADLLIAVRTIPDIDIVLRVVDAETREPVAGARAVLEMSRGQRTGLQVAVLLPNQPMDGVADKNGRIGLRVKSWMRASCEVFAPEYGPRVQVVYSPTATTAVDGEPILVELARSARIEGSVNEHVADSQVRAQFAGPAVETKPLVRDSL